MTEKSQEKGTVTSDTDGAVHLAAVVEPAEPMHAANVEPDDDAANVEPDAESECGSPECSQLQQRQ